MKRNRAFTLIELLIVVAIIAILAAIAIPNFLEAQVRSKVSRGEADMRSIATGLEAYRVDNNVYPNVCYQDSGGAWHHGSFEAALGKLTSPISYLTSIPTDVFDMEGEAYYKYYDKKTAEPWGLSNGWANYWLNSYGGKYARAEWTLVGLGPDGKMNWEVGVLPQYTEYDPTNGTVSLGDVIRSGP